MKDYALIALVYIVIGAIRLTQVPRWLYAKATGGQFKWFDFSGPQ